MTRQQAEPEQHDIRHLGHWIGEALGQGIAQGLQEALAESQLDLSPFVDVVLNVLRQEALAAGQAVALAAADEELTEADEQLAAIARTESLRPCEEEGCAEPAIARNLCRRHYARKLYQERKERLGLNGYRVVQSTTQFGFGGSPVADKKPLAPVGPIIRRKRTDGPEVPAPIAASAAPPPPVLLKPVTPAAPIEIAPSPIAAAAAAAGVTVESVARFLMGGGKS